MASRGRPNKAPRGPRDLRLPTFSLLPSALRGSRAMGDGGYAERLEYLEHPLMCWAIAPNRIRMGVQSYEPPTPAKKGEVNR
eukprot:9501389-Pyramimonas_sp.AAC.1